MSNKLTIRFHFRCQCKNGFSSKGVSIFRVKSSQFATLEVHVSVSSETKYSHLRNVTTDCLVPQAWFIQPNIMAKK